MFYLLHVQAIYSGGETQSSGKYSEGKTRHTQGNHFIVHGSDDNDEEDSLRHMRTVIKWNMCKYTPHALAACTRHTIIKVSIHLYHKKATFLDYAFIQIYYWLNKTNLIMSNIFSRGVSRLCLKWRNELVHPVSVSVAAPPSGFIMNWLVRRVWKKCCSTFKTSYGMGWGIGHLKTVSGLVISSSISGLDGDGRARPVWGQEQRGRPPLHQTAVLLQERHPRLSWSLGRGECHSSDVCPPHQFYRVEYEI